MNNKMDNKRGLWKKNVYSKTKCEYFAKGFCKWGESCAFSHQQGAAYHEPPTNRIGMVIVGPRMSEHHNSGLQINNNNTKVLSKSQVPCRFFPLGRCTKGLQCAFAHVNETSIRFSERSRNGMIVMLADESNSPVIQSESSGDRVPIASFQLQQNQPTVYEEQKKTQQNDVQNFSSLQTPAFNRQPLVSSPHERQNDQALQRVSTQNRGGNISEAQWPHEKYYQQHPVPMVNQSIQPSKSPVLTINEGGPFERHDQNRRGNISEAQWPYGKYYQQHPVPMVNQSIQPGKNPVLTNNEGDPFKRNDQQYAKGWNTQKPQRPQGGQNWPQPLATAISSKNQVPTAPTNNTKDTIPTIHFQGSSVTESSGWPQQGRYHQSQPGQVPSHLTQQPIQNQAGTGMNEGKTQEIRHEQYKGSSINGSTWLQEEKHSIPIPSHSIHPIQHLAVTNNTNERKNPEIHHQFPQQYQGLCPGTPQQQYELQTSDQADRISTQLGNLSLQSKNSTQHHPDRPPMSFSPLNPKEKVMDSHQKAKQSDSFVIEKQQPQKNASPWTKAIF